MKDLKLRLQDGRRYGFESHHLYNMVTLAERFRRRIVVPVYVGSSPTLPPQDFGGMGEWLKPPVC